MKTEGKLLSTFKKPSNPRFHKRNILTDFEECIFIACEILFSSSSEAVLLDEGSYLIEQKMVELETVQRKDKHPTPKKNVELVYENGSTWPPQTIWH